MNNPLSLDLENILTETHDLWEAMRGERLFITGGTGFFGCWMLESFLWANSRLNLGANVTILTRNPDRFISKTPHLALGENVTLLGGDVRSFSFPEGNFSFMIHAATEASAKLNQDTPYLMVETIIKGTHQSLRFAKKCGAENYLFVSSGAVYGKQPFNLSHISEDYPGAPDPLDPHSAYGHGKRIAEFLCTSHSENSKTSIKIARCFAFVGPYLPLNRHFAIGNFIRDGLENKPIVINGDGTPKRSYLYSADLAVWLWTILFKGKALHPYNVGSPEALSIAEVAQTVAKQFPYKVPVEIRQTPDLLNPPEQYIPDIERAKRELGLEVRVDLETGIKRTILNYRNDYASTLPIK